MSSSPAPRRSQRERKQAKHFTSVTAGTKRRRSDTNTEPDSPPSSEPEDVPSPDEGGDEASEDEHKEVKAPKSKPTTTNRKGKAKAVPKPKAPAPSKKPRANKSIPPNANKTAARKARKPKEGDDVYDASQVAKDTKIAADNPLFNAIMNPSAALQSTAEDFLESLTLSPGAAQAELINLVLRACGCNDSVNGDEAVDYDGVVDALDNFTEGLKQENSPTYPLTSKLPVFRKFRKSLSEFIERLISSSADMGSLYTSDLMATLQQWVIAMSSSQIRSFRHTATVVALEVETALCEVAAAVEKEAETVGRQREGEKKRKGAAKGAGPRDKQLEGKAREIRERRSKLAEYLKEFVDGVFVHRYRDLDANIRAECVRAIGLWFKKYPAHFLDASYLRYVGWVLSDSSTPVRLEAVKALSGVYEQADFITSLNHFTERFKPRLIEMATGDTELSVRVAVIRVLSSIDGHSLLEEEEREKLCLLVFDEEAKIRSAVSQFVKALWEETVEERLAGLNKVSDTDRARAGIKALAVLLVKWGKTLDQLAGDSEEKSDEDGEQSEVGQGSSRTTRHKELPGLAMLEQRGRTTLAVSALWDEVDAVKDWEALLDVLLLDHSAAEEDQAATGSDRRPRPNGKSRAQDGLVDEAWRLEEVEENVLLEVLVASLRAAKAEVVGSKKGEEETVVNDITRALIKGLPRLFIKYQTDQTRIAEVLLIPTLMNLDLYLEMRMIAGYSSLWDDVIKQFLSHSSLTVLTHAMAAIRYFMDTTSLSNANSTKILELEDELSSALRDAVAGREEIEIASFTEDEVLSLSAICTRLAVLSGTRNMIAWMEEDEGGKQSSAFDIICAIAERGKLGYREEQTLIQQSLQVLTLHIIWKAKGLVSSSDPSPDETRYRESLEQQREMLLEKLVEYAIGTQSNTAEGVKRAAFKNLMNLHVLFASSQSVAADGSPLPLSTLALSFEDEVQYRCAGFIQAEIERYAESLEEEDEDEDGEESDADKGSDNDDEDKSKDGDNAEEGGEGKKPKKARKKLEIDISSRARLEREYLFIDVISTFLRAIRAGAIHIRHGSVLLAHYGRLGSAFDACSKLVVDVLREEGLMHKHGDIVVAAVTQAIQEAYNLVLVGVVRDETNCVQLAKLLSTAFVIRGNQLSILRKLESHYVVQIHTTLLTWISKRVATYQSSKNKKALKSAIGFFRVLIPLVSMTESRDALKIKAHMDQVLAQARVEVSTTLKLWEPHRAYEKRLSTAMSKDKGPNGRAKKGKNAKGTAGASSDEGTDAEKTGDEQEAPARPRPRPRPRALRSNRGIVAEEPEEEEAQPSPGPMALTPPVDSPVADTAVTPPRSKRIRAVYGSKSPNKVATPARHDSPVVAGSREPSVARSTRSLRSNGAAPSLNGFTTPKQSRKRPREDEEDDAHDDDGEGEDTHMNDGEERGVSTPADARRQSSEPADLSSTPAADIQVRRKRVRH